MASGRPRQPNDPSIMASVEAAVSTVARPNLIARLWHWRYELGLIAGGLLGAITIGYTLGLDWLIAVAAATMAIGVTAMVWPPSRQAIMARAWCVITPHRIRTGCTHAWIQTRDGRLPVVLYTVPADFGERVWLWCRAGITARDLQASRDVLRAACGQRRPRSGERPPQPHRRARGDTPSSRRTARRNRAEPRLAVPGPRRGRRRRP